MPTGPDFQHSGGIDPTRRQRAAANAVGGFHEIIADTRQVKNKGLATRRCTVRARIFPG
jgi:hypothetical protein